MKSNRRRLFSSLTLGLAACLTLVACLAISARSVDAAEWGNLKGRFIYKGAVKTKPISVTKDVDYCSKFDLHDESIVVGKDHGLENVFVYLYLKRGKSVDIHPDYEKEDMKPAVLDNSHCRFQPHALTVWTKRSLEIRNDDPGIGHNTNATLLANPKFNEQVTNGRPITKNFQKDEPIPATFACNVHPWMNAHVLIRDNPYMAVTNEKGEFEIKNIPAGEHEFIFWQEAAGNLRRLEVNKEKTDRKGRAELDIPAGKTLDLKEIVVTPKLLGQ